MNNSDKGYKDFLDSAPVAAPNTLSKNILANIQEKIEPKILTLFMKLGLVQAVTGLFSMFICPQYGMSFSGDKTLYFFIQKTFGHYACMISCGMIFTLFAGLATLVIFTKPELKKLFKFQLLIFPIVAIFSMSVFSMIVQEFYLNVSLLWLLGAILGYVLTIDVGVWYKSHSKNSLGIK